MTARLDDYDHPDEDIDELELVYAELKGAQHELEARGNRIKRLETEVRKLTADIRARDAKLEECLRYLENHYDVIDGGADGMPRPNAAMRLGNEVEWLLTNYRSK